MASDRNQPFNRVTERTGIMTATNRSVTRRSGYNERKKMLESRRRELLLEVQGKVRKARTDSAKEHDVLDQAEISEVDIQEEIEFALIQMKTETLNKIEAALRRLEEGTYGDCVDCGDEIAAARLRALLFAVRCRDCEEARETAAKRDRIMAQRHGASTPFSNVSNWR